MVMGAEIYFAKMTKCEYCEIGLRDLGKFNFKVEKYGIIGKDF